MSDNQLQNRADGLVARAQAILTKPSETWATVAKETDEPMKVLTTYVLPLAAIGPIAAFIGGQLFPMSLFGVTMKTSLMGGITTAVVTFVFALIGVFVIAFIANLMSKQFDGRDDFPAAFRLTAYAMTAGWIAGIFGIFPALAILALLGGLYSLFLFYKGATPVMGVPQDKAILFTVVVVVCAFVFNLIVGAIVASITAASMFGAAATIGANEVDGSDVNINSPYGSINVDEESGKTTMTIQADGETMTIEVPNEEE